MPFGKHKGRELNTLPQKYLRWLLRECSLSPQLKTAIRCVLAGEEIPPTDGEILERIEAMFDVK